MSTAWWFPWAVFGFVAVMAVTYVWDIYEARKERRRRAAQFGPLMKLRDDPEWPKKRDRA